jgi:hypothetical protein
VFQWFFANNSMTLEKGQHHDKGQGAAYGTTIYAILWHNYLCHFFCVLCMAKWFAAQSWPPAPPVPAAAT